MKREVKSTSIWLGVQKILKSKAAGFNSSLVIHVGVSACVSLAVSVQHNAWVGCAGAESDHLHQQRLMGVFYTLPPHVSENLKQSKLRRVHNAVSEFCSSSLRTPYSKPQRPSVDLNQNNAKVNKARQIIMKPKGDKQGDTEQKHKKGTNAV